jgi:dihydroneopterin aldolase
MDRIFIAGLRELGVHGALPEEQARPQPFEVDIELGVDLSRPGESDALEVCCADPRVGGVTVTVRKLHPPVRAMVDHVAVRIERH